MTSMSSGRRNERLAFLHTRSPTSAPDADLGALLHSLAYQRLVGPEVPAAPPVEDVVIWNHGPLS